MIKRIYYADLTGASIPEESWEGTVNSIYSKAVNLLHPSGYLISIVNNQNQMSDFGLVFSNFKLLLNCVEAKGSFVWENKKIIFSNLIIDLARSSLWNGTVFCENTKLPIDTNQLLKSFIIFAKEEGLSPLVTKKKGNIYSNAAGKMIRNAIEKSEEQGAYEIDLSFLVGMGIGFTPSGDDFLAGVMLYETISGINLINRESITTKLSGTTDGGRTLLSLALRGSFPFYLKQFAESILRRELLPDEVVAKAVIHGSTSGSDALTGFLWADEASRELQP